MAEKKITAAGTFRLLVAAGIISFIWRDPQAAGEGISGFLSETGEVVDEAFDRFGEFLESVGIGDDEVPPLPTQPAALDIAPGAGYVALEALQLHRGVEV